MLNVFKSKHCMSYLMLPLTINSNLSPLNPLLQPAPRNILFQTVIFYIVLLHWWGQCRFKQSVAVVKSDQYENSRPVPSTVLLLNKMTRRVSNVCFNIITQHYSHTHSPQVGHTTAVPFGNALNPFKHPPDVQYVPHCSQRGYVA